MRPRNTPGWSKLTFACTSVLLIVVKLSLVSRNEIIAVADDSAGFVRHSLEGLGELGPPIGYSLWLWLIREAAVPQRLAIELLYCGACICLAMVLARTMGLLLSIAALAALILSPATFYLFDRALSDPLFLCLTLFSAALSIVVLNNATEVRENRHALAVALGVLLGVMAVTRNESPLTLGWILWLGVLHFCAGKLAASTSAAAKASIQLILTVGLAYAVVSLSPRFYYQAAKGVWAESIATLPSHMRLLRGLASIEDGEPPLRHVAVSKKARDLAYQASPTLRTLVPFIERPDNMYVRASHDVGELPEGEIGSGWIWHVFNDAAIATMTGERTPVRLDAFWNQVNNELGAAFQSGQLASRTVVHPLLGPGVFQPFSRLPQGMAAAFNGSFNFTPRGTDQGFISTLFDQACMRRAWLTPPAIETARIVGWVFADSPNAERPRVQLGHEQPTTATTTWSDLEVTPKDDVSRAFAKDLRRDVQAFGFAGEVIVPRASKLVVRYRLGLVEVVDLAPVVNKVEKHAVSENGQHFVYRALDRFERSSRAEEGEIRLSWMGKATSSSGWQFAKPVFAFVVLAPFVLVFVARLRSTVCIHPCFFASLLLAGLVTQRLAFYALINENAWVIEPRYVVSVFPLLVCTLALLVALVGDLWRRADKTAK